ncbi:MAG: hypothetical protein GXP62_21490 [Oligoflexia bacterium]|nr:hypothetical protein [Oligoflexia bacterium]
MAQGMTLFRKGAYLDAMAVFYRAVKADPTNIEAERMCYVSCEFLAIQQLREDVLARQVSPEERVAIYQNAVHLGQRAARGRGDLDTAEKAIIAALEWYPQDATLTQLQTSVQAQRARASRTGSSSRSSKTTSSNRRSSSRSLSASDRRLARQYLDEGLQAVEDGRFVVARDRLTRAQGLDSSLSSARSNLADVNRVLDDRARSAYSQGRALEAAGNRTAAIAAYQMVVSYASSRQLSIRLQAQKRIDALQ